jgi:hypothetical protein
MKRFALAFVIAAGVAAAMRPAAAIAADKPALLSAKIASGSPPVRSDAPMTIVWKLTNNGTSILQGRLELSILEGSDALARVVSDEQTLVPGENLVRMTLPPLEASIEPSLNLILRFAGQAGAINLDGHLLRVPGRWQRWFVVGIIDDESTRVARPLDAALRKLRLEDHRADRNEVTITTQFAQVAPAELSPDPLSQCGYNLIAVAPAGLRALKDAQLKALLDWTEAGGSLLLLPGSEKLPEGHALLLDELARRSAVPAPGGLALPESAPKANDANEPQDPAPGADPAPSILLRRHGLGRVAILQGDPVAGLDNDKLLRSLIAFLWKMRADRAADFASIGGWSSPGSGPIAAAAADAAAQPDLSSPAAHRGHSLQLQMQEIARMRPTGLALSPLPLQSGDQLLARLLPRDLRVIPLSLIAFLLLLYVVLIGPVDYVFLGALRKRKYTWVMFPLVTVGFTLVLAQLAESYMNVSGNRRGVVVYDVGEKGRIVRGSRFETLFLSRQANVETPMTQGLLTAMNHQRYSSATWFNVQQNVNTGQNNMAGEPRYAGRIPAGYSGFQFVPQWTPQLNRHFWLFSGDAVKVPPLTQTDFDFEKFADPQVYQAAIIRQSGEPITAIRNEVRRAFGESAAAVIVTHDHKVTPVFGNVLQLTARDSETSPVNPYQAGYWNADGTSDFLLDICAAAPAGYFSIFSQVAPAGGADFEDLVLVDSSDPGQWLLVIVVARGDDLVLYRKLYHAGG